MFTRWPHVFVTLPFPTWALETKTLILSGTSTQRDCKWECSMTGSSCPFSEAPILVFLHDYACSKIGFVVALHGSCNLIESIPFDMNNSLDIPGDGFWCQKDGHLPNCFSLKSILQFIRQPLVNTLLVYKLSFGNKHHSNKFRWQLHIENKEQYTVHLCSSLLPFISHQCIL